MDFREQIKQKIIEFMREGAHKPLPFKHIVSAAEEFKTDAEEIRSILAELEKEAKVFETSAGKFVIPERIGLTAGKLQGNERGYGFLTPDDDNKSNVFIPAEAMNGAMHNDRVIIRIIKKQTEGRKPEGEVIKVIERANSRVVGTFDKNRYYGFVIPDDTRITGDIFIHNNKAMKAKNGDKVVVEISEWPEKRRNAEGRIIEILGSRGEPGVDILSIVKSYGFEQDFPDEVLEEVSSIPDSITARMIKGRKDLRGMKVITIDGEDAKDIDDAVSIEVLKNGHYRLGIHIADVSHYVKEGTAVDEEALRRGTSVYPVDRVIPMLPEKLSNGVCSLNPHVDRLALSVIMDIDANGKTVGHEICESVINSNARMTYAKVTGILENKDRELMREYDWLISDLNNMRKLSVILRKKRTDRGSIDFDFPESKIILDENGIAVAVTKRETTIADSIIEEFMLMCNETVAEHFFKLNIPFVYRIHEQPEIEKLEIFSDFLQSLGYNLKIGKIVQPKVLQQFLQKVKGKKEEKIISKIMLRSLMKAKYSHECAGHFGLAAKYYCHFTAPIRRYPDLMIHRIIKQYITKGITSEKERKLHKIVAQVAKTSSMQERAAEEAEMAAVNVKKVEFMKGKEGEIFEGIISGVVPYGMFVELDNTIEGFVRIEDVVDDFYVFNEKHLCFTGERTGKVYRIGDTVRVILVKADIVQRRIDFVIEDSKGKDTNGKKVGNTSKGMHKQHKSRKKAVIRIRPKGKRNR